MNDIDAPTVYLKSTCVKNGNTTDNCFTTMEDVVDWIDNTRAPKPSNTSPLLIDIGPGSFNSFLCSDDSHISLRGSGQEVTFINDTTGLGSIVSILCDKMNFQDLTVNGRGYWLGRNQSSTWTNVTLNGGSQGAWYDAGGTHYWFNSRILSDEGVGYYSLSTTNSWFFGTEFVTTGSGNFGTNEFAALRIKNGEVHLYGSVIRIVLKDGVTLPSGGEEMVAVRSEDNSKIHIHGTGIDVIGNEVGNDVTALMALNGGFIHANEASYVMKTGPGGVVRRIINNGGEVRAPYMWHESAEPPSVVSINGADTAVTTNNADNQPHLVIYSNNCPSSWFDIVTALCRP